MAFSSDENTARHAYLVLGQDPNKVALAVAVSLAENRSGDTNARNVNDDGSVDVGLWQINSIHRKDHPTWTERWLRDPANNATAMAAVSNGGTNWTPWVQYKNGKYKDYADRAAKAAADAKGGSGVDPEGLAAAIKDPVGTAEDILSGGKDLLLGPVDEVAAAIEKGVGVIVDGAKWITDVHNIVRVLYVVGGIALGVVALSIVAKPVVNDAVKTIKPI